MSEALGDDAFRKTPWIDWLATVIERHPMLLERLAGVETESVEAELVARLSTS